MPKDFIPSGDADLLLWAQANSALITANPTTYFLTPAIATSYAGYVTAFETKLAAARNENRGRVNVVEKDAAREQLVAYARSWARLVQGQMTITTAQRAALGLNLRDKPGTPVNPPDAPPTVIITQAIGHTLKLKVRGAESAGRRKPEGAAGATVFLYVGATPSADPSDWACQGQTTRGDFDLQVAPTVPAGSRVWISAVWYSPRGVYTEMSDPISAYVAGGIAAAGENTNQELTPAATPALKAA